MATLGVSMQRIKCPCCGADVKDWREFVKNHPKLAADGEAEKPFQCVGFRCGKRFSEAEILQKQGEQNGEG